MKRIKIFLDMDILANGSEESKAALKVLEELENKGFIKSGQLEYDNDREVEVQEILGKFNFN